MRVIARLARTAQGDPSHAGKAARVYDEVRCDASVLGEDDPALGAFARVRVITSGGGILTGRLRLVHKEAHVRFV